MKQMIFWATVVLLFTGGCKSAGEESVERITEPAKQDSIFRNLRALGYLRDADMQGTVAVMILPLQASCPSCRSKVITSIASHRNRLPGNHFIVISVSGGRKIINSYFRDENLDLPVIPGKLFLDSTNIAYDLGLYDNKPTFYYASAGKVYLKVAAYPSTVKEDLREFFYGSRKSENHERTN